MEIASDFKILSDVAFRLPNPDVDDYIDTITFNLDKNSHGTGMLSYQVRITPDAHGHLDIKYGIREMNDPYSSAGYTWHHTGGTVFYPTVFVPWIGPINADGVNSFKFWVSTDSKGFIHIDTVVFWYHRWIKDQWISLIDSGTISQPAGPL